MISGETPMVYERSEEYTAPAMNAMETGVPTLFYGNLRNHGLIENLPPEAAVEVPCVADATGITPARVGRIPAPLASLMRVHIGVHELAVAAAKTHDRRLVEQAVALDPMTAAICSLSQIRSMVAEMFEASRAYLPEWG
jgi:alpha-galactosidase